MTTTPEPVVLLTVKEAARRLSIGRTKTFALIRSGALESILIGRARRVLAQSVADYCERQRTTMD